MATGDVEPACAGFQWLAPIFPSRLKSILADSGAGFSRALAGAAETLIPSSSIRVGDLVLLEKNQRVLADLILLRTSDSSGTCFIRTDQLDGETDWKLRVAVPATQKLPFDYELLNLDAEIYGASLIADYIPLFVHTPPIPAADASSKDIHAFIGTSTINTSGKALVLFSVF
ncbi:hypothetical protein F5888DRAFT_1866433 [Russula emetica]|nr:hypothetical protein F5888DRAFT_1866433 [Russula emetica]